MNDDTRRSRKNERAKERAKELRRFEREESRQRYLARTFTPPFKWVTCDWCNGSGWGAMGEPYLCNKCKGRKTMKA